MGDGQKERLLSIIENTSGCLQKIYKRDGEVSKRYCNTIYAMIPSNSFVNGFANNITSSWNMLREQSLRALLDLARDVLDDKGILVLTATKYMAHRLLEFGASGGWENDHIVTVMCKEPIGTWNHILVTPYL